MLLGFPVIPISENARMAVMISPPLSNVLPTPQPVLWLRLKFQVIAISVSAQKTMTLVPTLS